MAQEPLEQEVTSNNPESTAPKPAAPAGQYRPSGQGGQSRPSGQYRPAGQGGQGGGFRPRPGGAGGSGPSRDRDRDKDGGPGGRPFRRGGPGGPGGPGGRFQPRRKVCLYCANKEKQIDWKNLDDLRRFVNDNGGIFPRRKTGMCAKHQRGIAVAIKRARHIALLPYTGEQIRIMGNKRS